MYLCKLTLTHLHTHTHTNIHTTPKYPNTGWALKPQITNTTCVAEPIMIFIAIWFIIIFMGQLSNRTTPFYVLPSTPHIRPLPKHTYTHNAKCKCESLSRSHTVSMNEATGHMRTSSVPLVTGYMRTPSLPLVTGHMRTPSTSSHWSHENLITTSSHWSHENPIYL